MQTFYEKGIYRKISDHSIWYITHRTTTEPSVVQRSITIPGNFSEIFGTLSRHRATSKAEPSVLTSPPPSPLLSCHWLAKNCRLCQLLALCLKYCRPETWTRFQTFSKYKHSNSCKQELPSITLRTLCSIG